jgi:hypothetical protein
MSAAGNHPNTHDEHAGHHDDGHHAPEPPPDEPKSPVWLPLLGGALFLAALLLFLVTRSPEAEEPTEAEPTPADSASAAPEQPSPP